LVPELVVRRDAAAITTAEICIEEAASWPPLQDVSAATASSAQRGTALQRAERAAAAASTPRDHLPTHPGTAKIGTDCSGSRGSRGGSGSRGSSGTITGCSAAPGEVQTPFVKPVTMTPNALLWEDEAVSEVVFNPLFYGDDVI
jgi:hypothetical protein